MNIFIKTVNIPWYWNTVNLFLASSRKIISNKLMVLFFIEFQSGFQDSGILEVSITELANYLY